MANILHIASSSNLQSSVSRQIGSLVIQGLKEKYPDAKIIERDLIKNPLPHLNPEFVSVMFSGQNDAPALALSEQLIEELMGSDLLVIEAPMYNFTIPSALKAWIDHVVRAGRTFSYGGPNGPEGLVKGKKVILVLSRGGIYSEGAMKLYDFQEPYLKGLLGFLGLTDIETIDAEGVVMGADTALAKAKQSTHELIQRFSA